MEQENFPVKYCLDCKTVYEMGWKTEVIYYNDFPTYRLERETCYNCKNK